MGRRRDDIISSFVVGILIILAGGLLPLFAVHFGKQHQDRFVDDLTSPGGVLWLGLVTVWAVFRLWRSRLQLPK